MNDNNLDKLESVLVCAVCRFVPREGPIFQCGNGHLACKDCSKRLVAKTCPVCRMPLPKERIRSIAVEQVIESCDFAFPCVHDGCEHSAPKEALRTHEKNCVSRPVRCPFTECSRTLPYKNVLGHLYEHTGATFQAVHESGITCQKWTCTEDDFERETVPWVHVTGAYRGLSFFPIFVKKNHRYYVWMQVLGGEDIAHDFRVALIAKGPATSVVHTAKVFPIDTKRKRAMRDEENVLSFGEDIARRIFTKGCSGKGHFKIVYQILENNC